MADAAPPTLPDLNSGPRNFITTSTDHGGIALVVCTLMATWVVMCFFVRLYMRATVNGPFGIDDWVCSLATIFGVVQMIVSAVAVSLGFGKYLDLLTASQIASASKAIYAAQLLYIVTNTLTKCTVSLLLARIVFIKSRVYICYGVLVASVLWGFGSFIAEAVRCTGSPPWQVVGTSCSNLYLAWEVITAFNVIIEIVLLGIPLWLVWGLRTNFMRKFTVVAIFWLRSPVIIAALLRLHFLSDTIGSAEPLFNGVIPFTLLNIEMHYGLMAATMPTLKPFVRAFNTGWGTYDTSGLSGYGQGSNAESHALQSLEKRKNSKVLANLSSDENKAIAAKEMGGSTSPPYGKNITHVRSGKNDFGMTNHRSGTGHSDSSSSNNEMIIHQTTTCEIHYEGDERAQSRDFLNSRGEDSLGHHAR